MQTPQSIGHRRCNSAISPPPTTACQTLVISDGTTRIAAACAGDTSSPSSPIETVGKPSPMTPLTKPASKKAASRCGENYG
jgi:hypothetical protein